MDDDRHLYPFGRPHWLCEPRNRFRADLPDWFRVVLAAIAVIYLFRFELFRGILAVAVGAWGIRSVVRLVNRYSDARYQKRPPDAP